jgi:hypothetical protein
MFEEFALLHHAQEFFDAEEAIVLPSTSPGRGLRVVADTLMVTFGSLASSPRDSVVLPAPDGEDSTSINPRRWISTDINARVCVIRRSAIAPGTGRLRP